MAEKRTFSPFVVQSYVTLAVCFNIIGQGCEFGYMATLLPALNAKDSSIPISKLEESWIASMMAFSMILGSLISPPLMDRLGRKPTHIILTIPGLVGWFMIVVASSATEILVARFLHGISAGILIILRSALIGEYTSPKNRGAFLTTVSFSQAFGIFFAHLVGSIFDWHTTALICAFIPFISLVMTMYTPESPSWLLTRGRIDDCRKVFHHLRGDDENEELDAMIQARLAYEKMKIHKVASKNRLHSMMETIKKKEFYKPTILIIHANFIMQYSGGATMAAFATVIIGILMGPKANVAFWMVFLDVQRITLNLIAIYVMNKVKRRTMMFTTVGICVISHVAIATYVLCRLQGWSYDAIWLPALLINIHIFSVATGTVPLPNIIAGEVFPLQYRSICGTISLTSGGVIQFVVLKTFPPLLDSMGLHGTYYLFSAILASNLLIVMWLLPETKGKSLQQIEDEFRGKPLRLDELEARQSLQVDPVEIYKRRVSQRSNTLTI